MPVGFISCQLLLTVNCVKFMEASVNKNSVLLKNILLIVVAIIFGGLAFWLSKQYMAKQELELMNKIQRKTQKMASVVVASKDISQGTNLSAENLAVAEISAEHAPLDVITPDDFDQIKEHTALLGIPRGTPILRQYVTSAVTERFSDLLLPGQRALTFPVDILNSSDGMLKPGDKVDLFLLSDVSNANAVHTEKELISLLQNVTVLATGKIPTVPLPNQPPEGAESQYQTITIAVIPQDAQKVLLAKDNGNIVTLLRNRNDDAQLPANILHYASLKNRGNHVEYFSGSTAEAGILKAQLQPVHSITPDPEYPLQYWKSDTGINK